MACLIILAFFLASTAIIADQSNQRIYHQPIPDIVINLNEEMRVRYNTPNRNFTIFAQDYFNKDAMIDIVKYSLRVIEQKQIFHLLNNTDWGTIEKVTIQSAYFDTIQKGWIADAIMNYRIKDSGNRYNYRLQETIIDAKISYIAQFNIE